MREIYDCLRASYYGDPQLGEGSPKYRLDRALKCQNLEILRIYRFQNVILIYFRMFRLRILVGSSKYLNSAILSLKIFSF